MYAQHKFSLNCLSKQIKQHYFTPLFLTVCGILSTSALAQSNQTQAFYLVDADGNHLLDANGQKVAIYTMPSNQGTALGQNAQTKNDTSTAIGKNANASTADNAVAVGINTNSALSSVAVGNNSKANGNESIAIGLNAKSSGWRDIAIGYNADTTGVPNNNSATAVGNQSKATSWGATAYGTGAEATATNTNAIGNQAKATGALSTSLGTTARSSGSYALALGTLSNAIGHSSIATGLHSYATGTNAMAEGSYSIASGDYSIAQGYEAASVDISSTSVGIRAKTDGGHSTALGRQAKALAYKSTAVGSDAGAYTENSLALGEGTTVGADQELIDTADKYFKKLSEYNNNERVLSATSPTASTYQGFKTKSETFKAELDALKIQYDAAMLANADNKNSTGIGVKNKVTAQNTQVLGNNITADIENSVYLGNDTTAVKDAGKNTKIVRTPSQTTPGETEVTIEQGNTTTGGATGTVSEATINGVTYGNFAGATAKGGLSVGAADNERRIMNVAAGEIAETSTDAINGSQLYSVVKGLNAAQNNVAVIDSKINDMKVDIHNQIHRESKHLRAGIAGSNAAASLPQVRKDGKSMVMAAVGTYGGESAVAVGYSKASDSGKVVFKMQANANSRGKVGGGAGVGYEW